MSTTYHRLRQPFTSIRVTVAAGHSDLHLWVNHAKTGSITLRNEEVPPVLQALSDEYDVVVQYRSPEGKTRLLEREEIEPATTLLSEYGEITTLFDLRQKATQPAPATPAAPDAPALPESA